MKYFNFGKLDLRLKVEKQCIFLSFSISSKCLEYVLCADKLDYTEM